MHEIGLCQELVLAAHRRAAGRTVRGVRVQVGVLHRVDAPSMDQAFELLTHGTELEGARLDMVTVPATVRCAACGVCSATSDPLPACPACGALDPQMTGGDELMLESIELAPASSGSTV